MRRFYLLSSQKTRSDSPGAAPPQNFPILQYYGSSSKTMDVKGDFRRPNFTNRFDFVFFNKIKFIEKNPYILKISSMSIRNRKSYFTVTTHSTRRAFESWLSHYLQTTRAGLNQDFLVPKMLVSNSQPTYLLITAWTFYFEHHQSFWYSKRD